MTGDDWLADRFEEHRAPLRAVARRMLGSTAEADDAVQEAWLRLQRTGAADIDNLGGWLRTVVARICLNQLRARAVRREEPLDIGRLPDPVVTADRDPETDAVLADTVGLALLVVLDTLGPAERLAFVLRDLFGLPYAEIAALLDRSEPATRQLASRARRRVRGAQAGPGPADRARQRSVVDAFFLAARGGDLAGLVAVLHPEVELHSDHGSWRPALTGLTRGASAVAGQARLGAVPNAVLTTVRVDGRPGVVVTVHGRPFALMGFHLVNDRIVRIDAIAEPERVARLMADVLA